MTVSSATRDSSVEQVIVPPVRELGDGFKVHRALPSAQRRMVGPFIFLDHFGPIGVKPGEAKGASAHPHAGIETLTLLLDGSSQHKEQPGQHEQHASRRGAVAAPAGA